VATTWLERIPGNPVPWLLEFGCAPIRLRTLTEILGRPADDADVQRAREDCDRYQPSLQVLGLQQPSGLWLDKLLEYEPPNKSRHRGPGMVNQFLFLVERGWGPSHPVIHLAAERLLDLVHEEGGSDLCELKGYTGSDRAAQTFVRRCVSEIAASVLARAGFADDAEVTRVAERVAEALGREARMGDDRFDGVLEVPEDGSYRRLKPERLTPDMFTLYILAFHPGARRIAAANGGLDWVARELGERDATPRRVREVKGKKFLKLTDLHLRVWTQDEFQQGRVGYLLHDLEVLVRCGLLEACQPALRCFEGLFAHLRPPEEGYFDVESSVERGVSRSQYHYFPLEESWRGKHRKSTDVMFRLTLIATLLDRMNSVPERR
jgi:hypothetical protein